MFGSCPSPPLRGAYSETSLSEIVLRLSSDSQTNQLHNFKMFTHCTWCNIGITLLRSKRTIIFSYVPTPWSRMLVVKITFAQLVSNFHCVLWKQMFHHVARESMPQTLPWTTWISFTSLPVSMRFILITSHHGCRHSVVCLATHYGMGGQEFEPRWGQNISFSPHRPYVQTGLFCNWYWVLSHRWSEWGMKLTTYPI